MTDTSLWMMGLPVAASPLVYIVGRLGVRRTQPIHIGRWAALLIFAALWWLYATLLSSAAGAATFTVGAAAFHADGISLLLIGVTLTLTSAALLFSMPYIGTQQGEEKYYAGLVVMTGAIIGLVTAQDLFNLWVWFELLTVSSYFLVMFTRDESLEAGVKYLVQSAAGSALILFGIALVLAETGILDLTMLRVAAGTDPFLLAAGGLMLVGFGVKVALVPMHTWLPDAHAQAPSSISALLSGIVIEAALIALLRVLMALAGVTPTWGALLLGFGAANILLGNLMALKQQQVKRLLAYSSISHVGVMLLGLGVTLAVGDAAGAQGGFFHLLTHALMKGLAFMAVGVMMFALGAHTLTRADLAGLGRRLPITALLFSLALLSLGGLPPLAGFMSKWQVFVAGASSGDGWLLALMIFAALNSVLSLGYYMPLINAMYRQEGTPQEARAVPLLMLLPLLILAVLIVVLGVLPALIDPLTVPAAQVLTSAFGG